MEAALAESERGLGLTAPNPAVGAVVVKGGRIVGRGAHLKAGKPHAEPLALKEAGEKARGADLYVTLEPCSTTGRTPPCTQAVLEAGIRRVVVGCVDPNPAHAGKGLDHLRKAGIEVVEGVCQEACEHRIRAFAHLQATGRPYVTLKLGCTLDGRIADRTGTSQWITGPASRERVQALRREADAVLVGTETVRVDDPSLLPWPAYGHVPLRIIPDRQGRLSLRSKVFSDAKCGHTLCALGSQVSSVRENRLLRAGVQVERWPVRQGHFSWKAGLTRLGQRGCMHLLCEGGGALSAALLRQGLVQEIHWIVAPRLLGQKGVPAVADAFRLATAPEFQLQKVEQVGQDVWLHLLPKAERHD